MSNVNKKQINVEEVELDEKDNKKRTKTMHFYIIG